MFEPGDWIKLLFLSSFMENFVTYGDIKESSKMV